MTDTFQLAARLRSLDDDALVELIRARRVLGANGSGSGIRDYFDLADALSDPDSVQRALAALDRRTLAALAALGDAAGPGDETTSGPDRERLDAASALFLVAPHGGRFALYDSVRAQLASWPERGLPSAAELRTERPPAALALVSGTESRFTDRLASEHGFTIVTQVAQVIAELERAPARELQRGGLALPDAKRIAAALAATLDEVATVVSIAERAGLIALEDNSWLPTRRGRSWQAEPTPQRWGVLAGSWLAALPAEVRALLSDRAHAEWGDSLRAYVAWEFPAGGEETLRRVSGFVRDAERLGITANDAPSHAGSLLLEGAPGRDEEASLAGATAAIAEHFPAEVDRIYLQNDLTAVAAGPLDPAVDARVRRIAEPESRGLATTYRISPESLGRAIADGEDAGSIRRFLAEISTTGIPQPVEYLINEAADRYGRVRVASRTDGEPGSVVRSADAELLRTIEVDSALSSLGLRPGGPGRLVSRRSREETCAVLGEARYPVAAEDAEGTIVDVSRVRVADPAGPGDRPRGDADDAARSLVSRLRESAPTDDDAHTAWIGRQLDIAIRGRITVTVRVRMPDGHGVDYVLEPSGSAGGRLRGRDRRADLERTLPLSRIESVEAAVDSTDNV